ncbi:hypothetical protein [Kibdelosporangium aridum]|uniref:hypothetical protein n=1 Tax=Kibdelosporangium aridum TaxID=2030 RepID=UPI0035EE3F3B
MSKSALSLTRLGIAAPRALDVDQLDVQAFLLEVALLDGQVNRCHVDDGQQAEPDRGLLDLVRRPCLVVGRAAEQAAARQGREQGGHDGEDDRPHYLSRW